MHRQNLVFRDDPDPDDGAFFEGLMAAVNELNQIGYRFAFETEEHGVDEITMVWEDADELGVLTLVKDLDTEVCSMQVLGMRLADVRRIREHLEAHLDIVPIEELAERARTAVAREPTVLVKLAIAADDTVDPDLVPVFQRALEHRLSPVRYYAAWAIAIVRWPRFIPDLESLLKLEPDEDVEAMAEQALAGCRLEERLIASRR